MEERKACRRGCGGNLVVGGERGSSVRAQCGHWGGEGREGGKRGEGAAVRALGAVRRGRWGR